LSETCCEANIPYSTFGDTIEAAHLSLEIVSSFQHLPKGTVTYICTENAAMRPEVACLQAWQQTG